MPIHREQAQPKVKREVPLSRLPASLPPTPHSILDKSRIRSESLFLPHFRGEGGGGDALHTDDDGDAGSGIGLIQLGEGIADNLREIIVCEKAVRCRQLFSRDFGSILLAVSQWREVTSV